MKEQTLEARVAKLEKQIAKLIPSNERFWKRYRKYKQMISRGYNQRQISKECGISEAAVSKTISKGKNMIDKTY